jgi:hypothetical protein
MTEALVKFQAETMMETMPAAGPVKTQIIGKETAEKKAAAAAKKGDKAEVEKAKASLEQAKAAAETAPFIPPPTITT